MKFGRLIYKYTGRTIVGDGAIYNIGDNIQTFAIDALYSKMGIPEEDIIDINVTEMKYYDGDYVILPMAGYASHYKRFNQLPCSDKIIPFFISFEMSNEECDDIVPYLKKCEPIFCRDEATMFLLRRKGIESYISGCATITLPKRKSSPSKGKIFLVDVPVEVEEHMPNEYLEKGIRCKHEGHIKKLPFSEEERLEIDVHARKMLDMYEREASLIITSRLHAAAPCIALGIPVILVIYNIDERFSWLDKLIPLYDSSNYGNIDWYPKAVDVEEIKELFYNIFKDNLLRIQQEKKDILQLTGFWEQRNRVEYDKVLCEKLFDISKKYEMNEKFNYAIWGGGVHGKKAYSLMKSMFPNAKLTVVIDKYMTGQMFGVDIVHFREIQNWQFNYMIVTTHPGRFEAKEILENMNMKEGVDWCYFISKDIS